jgi:hypothetical protein
MFMWELQSGAHANDIRPIDVIGQISPRPVLIIDGWNSPAKEDAFVQRLYEAAREPKEIWMEKGVPHMRMYSTFPQEYTLKVLQFFEKVFVK